MGLNYYFAAGDLAALTVTFGLREEANEILGSLKMLMNLDLYFDLLDCGERIFIQL